MDEQLKNDVELAVYRILGENEGRYREHLERQLGQLKWSVSVIMVAFLAVFGFLFGKTFSEVKATVEGEVKARVTDSAFAQELERQMTATTRQILDKAQAEISDGAKAAVEAALANEAGKRLNEAVDAKIRSFTMADLGKALLPRGAIVAWTGEGSTPPDGWAFCDGASGTPDLRNRYVVGTMEASQVGKATGAEAHTHKMSSKTGIAEEFGGERGYHVTNDRRGDSPSATPYHHVHSLSGSTDAAANQPPSVYVRFIIKL